MWTQKITSNGKEMFNESITDGDITFTRMDLYLDNQRVGGNTCRTTKDGNMTKVLCPVYPEETTKFNHVKLWAKLGNTESVVATANASGVDTIQAKTVRNIVMQFEFSDEQVQIKTDGVQIGITVTGKQYLSNGNTRIRFSDGSFVDVQRGLKGDKGDKGDRGPDGRVSFDRLTDRQKAMLKGADGRQGVDGKSAYEIAKANGYSGSESQWLASLKGERGATGATGARGPKGDKGDTGAQGPAGASQSFRVLTQTQYKSLSSKSSGTLYYVKKDDV